MSEKDHQPPKGILKHSVDGKGNKTFKWDEMNIMATFHPADKTYGHMHVDEPDTPYNYEFNPSDPSSTVDGQAVSPEQLASLLEKVVESPPRALSEESPPDSPVNLSPAELERRRMFEKKRKMHYNEYIAAHSKQTSEGGDDELEEIIDPVALRNAQLNAQLGKTRPTI